MYSVSLPLFMDGCTRAEGLAYLRRGEQGGGQARHCVCGGAACDAWLLKGAVDSFTMTKRMEMSAVEHDMAANCSRQQYEKRREDFYVVPDWTFIW